MEKTYESCNFLCLTDESVPGYPLYIRKRVHGLTASVFSSLVSISHPKRTTREETSETNSPSPEHETLNLQPGELVEVKSVNEIVETLDERQKYKGLYFMPEMEKFCGKKFRVFKRAEIITLESTGEVRKLRVPTVFLEGVYCTGELHDGCDRSCFHFWREVWLKRIPESNKNAL